MTTSPINFQPKLDELRGQINELVRQYAELAHAPKTFVPGQSAVPVSGKVIGTLAGWLADNRPLQRDV